MTTSSCQAPGTHILAETTRDRGLALYAMMLRLRRFEEKAGMLYAMGTLATPCPLGIGQEGAVAALVEGLSSNDIVLVLEARPAVELALGAPAKTVFQRLASSQPANDQGPLALLREPCSSPRLLPREDALNTASAVQGEPLIVVAPDPTASTAIDRLANGALTVFIVPSDSKPEVWPRSLSSRVRECDGADVEAVAAAIAAARGDHSAGHRPLAVAILTPPYIGHSRDPGHRQPTRRNLPPDPLALHRRRLVGSGRLTEADAVAVETAVRDEIAAAARSMFMACAP